MLPITQSSVFDIQRARAMFFQDGTDPAGLIDPTVLESWRRCAQIHRRTGGDVVFNVRERSIVSTVQEANSGLIQDFNSVLEAFARVLDSSGFHPVLVDTHATTIARSHNPLRSAGALYDALQLGSDMSEAAIGTAAMNCALASHRPVQVFGHEHYFDANASFSCAAAPIFGFDGRLLGAVNLTKYTQGREFGALSFVESCATAIEHRQLERLLAHLTIRISWTANGESRNATVAFGEDGQILGMTREASRILNPLAQALGWLSFEKVFDGEFGHWHDLLRRACRPLPIKLKSGLFVFIEARNHSQPKSTLPAPSPRLTLPQMGDPSFDGNFNLALKAIGRGLPILIRGETGTGKEVIARSLHTHHCPSRPFVAINCAAIPETLIESELFGYMDGAFTGAKKGGATGRIEEADGGVLFLDEIGDMPVVLQARLLRVLDAQEVTRLGSGKARKVSFNLICATHQSLETLVEAGRFRADLFYRICGMTVQLKPLRDRTNLGQLFSALLHDKCDHTGPLSTQALHLLSSYPWPGNAREAVAVLKRATLMCEADETITAEHVRFALPSETRSACTEPLLKPPASEMLLADLEEQSISAILRSVHGNVSLAAERLGISRSTLQRRIRSNPRLLRSRDDGRSSD
ncbi:MULTISPECIES: sigma-54-dependent Fis family transcriptional regulator [Pseudomonas]|uniref:sigma-54-dependent Fis family transcriptional regulator n=1 Tax=Pseudomonas TaxID=286 RepID=UPI00224A8CD9|nr:MULTISPECIES: sigma-54-dependent Fis family transcriptional regulator [unclassified Pseudomonas]MCX2887784.1 sigma-54-dependent Fis family transcriptional regulator [Pseudomonas sp. DCB_BI]MDH4550793.1 sigma-54-dependent Fis family transcriptional regulator [Pseudomonas sp. BN607]